MNSVSSWAFISETLARYAWTIAVVIVIWLTNMYNVLHDSVIALITMNTFVVTGLLCTWAISSETLLRYAWAIPIVFIIWFGFMHKVFDDIDIAFIDFSFLFVLVCMSTFLLSFVPVLMHWVISLLGFLVFHFSLRSYHLVMRARALDSNSLLKE